MLLSSRARGLKVHCSATKNNNKPVISHAANKKPSLAALTSAATAAAAAAATPLAARADEGAAAADAIDSTVAAIADAVKAAGVVVKGGVEIVSAGASALKQGYDVVAPYAKEAAKAVAPALDGASKVASDAASKALPLVQDTLTGAAKSSGVDLNTVTKTAGAAAKTAAEGAQAATPFLLKVWAFLTTSSPATLAETAAALAAAYFLSPLLLGAAAGSLRGFAGELTPVQALDALAADGSAVLVDVRSEREKDAAGVPDVPGAASGRVADVELVAIADRKLRGSLRDAQYIEAQITALQVAALKRVSKGSKIILLDRNGGGAAKTIARELARLGYGKAFVVRGGFEGSGGWTASKLLVKPWAGSPGFAALPSFGTRTVSTRPGSSAATTRGGGAATTRGSIGTARGSTVRKQLPAPGNK